MLNICRLCESKLFDKPSLKLSGMPKAAQYFPEKKDFLEDKGIDLNIYQCSSCGLVQLNINPVDYFKEVITAASISKDAKISRLKQMKNFVSRFNLKGKKVIEIGSASGSMLDILEESGLKATGLESSLKSVETGKSSGRNMINGYLGDIEKIKGSPYDSFVTFNYLEHMPNPGNFIKKIYSNLVENGVGMITVPNLDYLLRTKCFYEFVADHLSYFTKETLKYAFEINSFEIIDCELINNDNDILAVVKKKKNIKKKQNFKKPIQINLSKDFEEVKILINDLRNIVSKYTKDNKKVVIWGAGHRTLALLALSNLKNIEFVVDSAKFKQNKFTPVIHSPILSPENLKKEKIDLIIVMVPGIYPDEVIKAVKKMGIVSDLAKLKDNKIEFI